MNKYSASSISAFKACPIRYRNAYVYRIRQIEETDSKRQGHVWHKLQEIMGLKSCGKCIHCEGEHCVFCNGTGILPENLLESVTNYINREYAEVPENKTREDWLIERTILLSSILGCLWYYQQHPTTYEVVVPELKFNIPIIIGGKTFTIQGKIDQIVKDNYNNYYVREFKSTSKSLDDETYWSHLNLDTQITIYLVAVQHLQMNGDLKQYGITPQHQLISQILYNVWHKPQIRPKKLTQSDNKKFVENGEYFGQKFKIEAWSSDSEQGFIIDGERAIIEPGAKEGMYAIYETPQMFGARLIQDIVERPTFYYRQVELTRTTKDLQKFLNELTNIIELSTFMEKHDIWFSNEQQCYAKFKCEYINVCANHLEIGPDNVPNGFKYIKEENKNDSENATTQNNT